MLPILLLGAGVWAWHKHKTTAKPSAPTPALARLHGELMGAEYNPVKLDKAAGLFRSRGMLFEARNLQSKAGEVRKQAAQIPDIVKRARSNDQNAIGMIAAVRESAAANDPRAIVAANLIAKYCQKYPAPPLGPLGEVPMFHSVG